MAAIMGNYGIIVEETMKWRFEWEHNLFLWVLVSIAILDSQRYHVFPAYQVREMLHTAN